MIPAAATAKPSPAPGVLARWFGAGPKRGGGVSLLPAPSRSIEATPPEAALQDVLAEKVLNAWLQNRQQTLFPLTVNFRTLDPSHAPLLLRAAALTLSMGRAPDATRMDAVRRWLASVGAGAEHLAGFAAALKEPPAPGPLLHDLEALGLGAYAYAVSLSVMDRRDPAAMPFLAFLAARLSVPASVVRSVHRRNRA